MNEKQLFADTYILYTNISEKTKFISHYCILTEKFDMKYTISAFSDNSKNGISTKNYDMEEKMRLLIKQRVFSWTDSYDIYDEKGNQKYFVKAEFLSLGHRLHVNDTSGREIGVVKQRIFTLLPAFDIEIDGREVGSIQKQFTLFRPRYDIYFNGWRCEGDFMSWDYEVYSGFSSVVHISKELFHWGDTYVIDIQNPEDEVMALMLVLAIDAANCTQNN